MKKDMDLKEGKDLNNFSLGLRMAEVLLISIFIGEGLVMLLIRILHIKYFVFEALVDSLILSFLTFPSIYYFVIRPFNIQSAKRKQAEEALKDSEARFRSVLETMSLIGVMIDSKGRITLCNDYLLAL